MFKGILQKELRVRTCREACKGCGHTSEVLGKGQAAWQTNIGFGTEK